MGLLGTIFSVIPTVAGVIGNLLGANNKDYIKLKMYQPSATNDEPNVYFVKTDDDRILLYNSCGYPIHVSMENVGVESDKGYILEDCGGGLDVTDLIASHSAKYENALRITANVEDSRTDGVQTGIADLFWKTGPGHRRCCLHRRTRQCGSDRQRLYADSPLRLYPERNQLVEYKGRRQRACTYI